MAAQRYVSGWVLGAAVMLAPALAQADLNCGGQLVSEGDRAYDVRQRCGEPDARDVISTRLGAGHGEIPHEEVWHYNFGPSRLVRVLVFREGRLEQIETGGRGFRERSASCKPEELTRDLTKLELLGRCGEPDAIEQRVEPAGLSVHPGVGIGYGRVVEEWIYDYGPQRFYRIVTLREGRVTRIERGERGYRH